MGDVFNIVVQRIGPESNGSFSSPRTQNTPPPSTTGFRRVMEIMSNLQYEGLLQLSILGGHHYPLSGWGIVGNLITKYQYDKAQSPLTMNFDQTLAEPGHPMHAEFIELFELLRVSPDSLSDSNSLYPDCLALVVQDATYPGTSGLKIQTRSFHQMLWFLSFAVEVPRAAVENEEVWLMRDEDGSLFDFSSTYEGILEVQCSESEPERAAISIRYQDHWYWIARNDLKSKQTFVLLGQMVQMQSSASTAVPALTISGD